MGEAKHNYAFEPWSALCPLPQNEMKATYITPYCSNYKKMTNLLCLKRKGSLECDRSDESFRSVNFIKINLVSGNRSEFLA